MKKKVVVFTGARSEYGIMYWLLNDLKLSSNFELQLIVGGMHLSPEFGESWQEITADGFNIDARVEMLLSSDSRIGVAKSIGLGVIGLADALDRLRPDIAIVLGDRFEALAFAQSALIMDVPLMHLHGGELTEGAYDDSIRHAITNMASLHCVAAETYRNRVIQMGEHPKRVFNVGALGLDHMKRGVRLSSADLSESIGIDLETPYFLVTYHPVTAGAECPSTTLSHILKSLDNFPDHKVLLTFPNADNGGREIIPLLKDYAASNPQRIVAIPSLGNKLYLSALAGAEVVIGNSSSGIIEAPAFQTPTVNIGIRQAGRLSSDSVIHCGSDELGIKNAIDRALSEEFKTISQNASNPYGQGNASKLILELLEHDIKPSNSFYDVEF